MCSMPHSYYYMMKNVQLHISLHPSEDILNNGSPVGWYFHIQASSDVIFKFSDPQNIGGAIECALYVQQCKLFSKNEFP